MTRCVLDDGTPCLFWEGTYTPRRSERPILEALIEEVMADGVERTITLGEPAPQSTFPDPWRPPRGLTLAEEMDRSDTIL